MLKPRTSLMDTGRSDRDALLPAWLPTSVRLIAAFPGCGKTTAARRGGAWVDADSSPWQGPTFPEAYVRHLQRLHAEGACVLVSTHAQVREALHARGLAFGLVYPHPTAQAVYAQRYGQRPGSHAGPAFAARMMAQWHAWLASCAQDPTPYHRVLQAHEFLAEALPSPDA